MILIRRFVYRQEKGNLCVRIRKKERQSFVSAGRVRGESSLKLPSPNSVLRPFLGIDSICAPVSSRAATSPQVLRVSYIIAGRDVISTRRGEWKDVLSRISGDYERGIDRVFHAPLS